MSSPTFSRIMKLPHVPRHGNYKSRINIPFYANLNFSLISGTRDNDKMQSRKISQLQRNLRTKISEIRCATSEAEVDVNLKESSWAGIQNNYDN